MTAAEHVLLHVYIIIFSALYISIMQFLLNITSSCVSKMPTIIMQMNAIRAYGKLGVRSFYVDHQVVLQQVLGPRPL